MAQCVTECSGHCGARDKRHHVINIDQIVATSCIWTGNFILAVNKAAPFPIWTSAGLPKSLADFCLVSWMSRNLSQLTAVMCKLAFYAVPTQARLFKGATHFGFVEDDALVITC
jgi:hypothetical protein